MPTVQQTANLRFWQPSSTILHFLHSFSFLWLSLHPLTFYASLFNHRSDILFREKYINPSFLCSTDTTMLSQTALISDVPPSDFLGSRSYSAHTSTMAALLCKYSKECRRKLHNLSLTLLPPFVAEAGRWGGGITLQKKKRVPWFRQFNYNSEN